jgi:hypothetical protein
VTISIRGPCGGDGQVRQQIAHVVQIVEWTKQTGGRTFPVHFDQPSRGESMVFRRFLMLACPFLILVGCAGQGPEPASRAPAGPAVDAGAAHVAASRYEATIRRTEWGVAHIEATDLGSLGFGEGYAQAEDHLCTIADQVVRVRGVAATGRLGERIFWGELGDMARQRPVLVRMDEEAAIEIEPGRAYTITGQVLRVTDDQVEEWGEAGEFAGEGEQMQATFADYYIQARSVRATPGQPGRQGG